MAEDIVSLLSKIIALTVAALIFGAVGGLFIATAIYVIRLLT